jgi:hypothetical protein
MTRKTNARLAGSTFLLYIVAGISTLVLFNKATGDAGGTAARLASIAQHAPLVRITVLLTLITFMCAVVLGVTLYALTREEDRDLALIALCCRATEGALGAASIRGALQLLALATASTAASANAADAAAVNAQASLMLNQGTWTGSATVMCFVIGSTIFSYLFLRAGTIPVALAWLGLIASVVLLTAVPIGLVTAINIPFLLWIPMLVFEVVFALWLIIKGVAASTRLATRSDGNQVRV